MQRSRKLSGISPFHLAARQNVLFFFKKEIYNCHLFSYLQQKELFSSSGYDMFVTLEHINQMLSKGANSIAKIIGEKEFQSFSKHRHLIFTFVKGTSCSVRHSLTDSDTVDGNSY